ncbi:MAG: hypothetical protein DIU56_014450 [Pseudomonadota bacterium]|jgi:hypothetical protein
MVHGGKVNGRGLAAERASSFVFPFETIERVFADVAADAVIEPVLRIGR